MNFSAKQLLTKSAKQLVFLQQHPQPQVITEQIMQGDHYQHDTAKGMSCYGEEMGCFIKVGEDYIHCTNDVVVNNHLVVEIKSVQGEAPDWYLSNSLFQCAIYKALIMESGGYLRTAQFYQNLGNELKAIKMDRGFQYQLWFGDAKYVVEVRDIGELIDFLYKKVQAIKHGYTTASEFDASWKFNETRKLSNAYRFYRI